MDRFYSPLRYPGGKTKLSPFIKSLLHENNLIGCDYIEPYAGGAGVALSLLFDNYVSTITINDYDLSIYAFWHSIIHENENLCKKIAKTSIDVKTWKKQKDIQKNKSKTSLFELGFSTFYLNRSNISGIIKGGLIGGMQQKGKYKMGDRFNKSLLISRIENIYQHKNKIRVTNEDAVTILSKKLRNSFIYLDPPYVNKAKDLYMNFYTQEDHQHIAELLLNEPKFIWLLSYDQSDIIKKLYCSCKNKISWNISYGSSNKKGQEDIFFHPQLTYQCSKDFSNLSVPAS